MAGLISICYVICSSHSCTGYGRPHELECSNLIEDGVMRAKPSRNRNLTPLHVRDVKAKPWLNQVFGIKSEKAALQSPVHRMW